jgi:hypothetical protein
MNNTPRRKTSAFLQESIELHTGHASVNLDEDDEQRRQHRKFGYVTRNVLLASTALIIVVFFLLAYTWIPYQTFSFAEEIEDDVEYVAIRLQPKGHIYREPRALAFDWTVTSGWGAPDGVQKQVYPINSKYFSLSS